jgi:hypothetical protein
MDFSTGMVARVRAAKEAAQREMESFGDVSDYDVTILQGQLNEDPLAVLISKVWTRANDPEAVREASRDVLAGAKDLFSDIAEEDAYPIHATEETRDFVTYWFDPQARRQLATLAVSIDCIPEESTRDVLWCAYSRLIITK